MTSSDDAALAERLLRRDETALRDVIAAYGAVVHGMARRTVVDPALAEEVAQDTFLALWRRPGAFDAGRGTLQSFLVGVARNKGIDAVRREESRRRTRDSLIAEVEATSNEAVGAEQMDEVDQRTEMVAALSELSPVQREAIVLAYFGGRTYREVAQELGIPEGTAKTRLRDGLTQLRELLKDREGNR
ncbi:MAG: sigma-70 family RNA polymerase sigma factor [Actinomycetota bacterium]|nr:sigma-70 family RNA polymerase sigma factor [Actinomycetota bacterium]